MNTLRSFTLRSWTVTAIAVALSAGAARAADGWISLFNGKDTTGWVQRGGAAKYRVEDGAVVGQTVSKTPNAFLCTAETYGDFVLEFEFKVEDGMNSGVQFRSAAYEKPTETEIGGKKNTQPAGRVYGYQYEIDTSPRAYTAGVYDEARRGWIADLKDNEAARKAFKAGAWNQARIECRGDHIQTWINGVKATDFRDTASPRGFIALQVHSIPNDKQPGQEVRWRNIRLKKL